MIQLKTSFLALTLIFFFMACGDDDKPADAAPADNNTNTDNKDAGNTDTACPQSNFMDMTKANGPGGSYPMPSLEVSCSSDKLNVKSNGIPHYTYVAVTPNALGAQNHNWSVPLNPELSGTEAAIQCLGDIGFSVNGIPIYGANEAQNPDPFGDPVANNVMDECEGHTGGTEDYHYHALLSRCLTDPKSIDGEEPKDKESAILGYALDGFPIYGPYGCSDKDCKNVVEFKSSWEPSEYSNVGCTSDEVCPGYTANERERTHTCNLVMIEGKAQNACINKDYIWQNQKCTKGSCNEASGEYLDRCNGRVGPDGKYRYHATSTFPYTIGCFKGTSSATGTGAVGEQCENQAGGPSGGGPRR